MSKKEAEDGEKKKKGGLIGKLLIPLVMLGAGGGGAYGLMVAGIIGGGHEEKSDPGPQLVGKEDEDPFAPAGGEKESEGPAYVPGEGGSKYRTAYYTFADEFTSNLRESGSLVQVSLACSTQRDGRVLMWLKEHELAIRSRILVELADTSDMELETPRGKRELQDRLTKAINEVLVEEEGFGGVDDVYFRTLIVQ